MLVVIRSTYYRTTHENCCSASKWAVFKTNYPKLSKTTNGWGGRCVRVCAGCAMIFFRSCLNEKESKWTKRTEPNQMNKRIECACVYECAVLCCVNALDMVFRLNILFSKKKVKWGKNILYYSASSKNGWKQNKTKGKKYPGRVGYGDKLGKSFSWDAQVDVCVCVCECAELCNNVHLLIIATTNAHTREILRFLYSICVCSAILGQKRDRHAQRIERESENMCSILWVLMDGLSDTLVVHGAH